MQGGYHTRINIIPSALHLLKLTVKKMGGKMFNCNIIIVTEVCNYGSSDTDKTSYFF